MEEKDAGGRQDLRAAGTVLGVEGDQRMPEALMQFGIMLYMWCGQLEQPQV